MPPCRCSGEEDGEEPGVVEVTVVVVVVVVAVAVTVVEDGLMEGEAGGDRKALAHDGGFPRSVRVVSSFNGNGLMGRETELKDSAGLSGTEVAEDALSEEDLGHVLRKRLVKVAVKVEKGDREALEADRGTEEGRWIEERLGQEKCMLRVEWCGDLKEREKKKRE